jgi:hypothetical protein
VEELMRKIWIAGMMATMAPVFGDSTAPVVNMLSRNYRLASFHQKPNPMWEFAAPGEKIDQWNTLVTVIDRADARTKEDLDRLAQGVDSNYQSNGGRILMAKTMLDHKGAPYNYIVAAFEEPAAHRFELNFVKVAMGPKNAYVLVYGARVTDTHDYKTKGKEFLDQHSGEIGRALEAVLLPEISGLPRREF